MSLGCVLGCYRIIVMTECAWWIVVEVDITEARQTVRLCEALSESKGVQFVISNVSIGCR